MAPQDPQNGPRPVKRGRPVTTTARRSIVAVRVPDDVYDRLLQRAAAEGLTLSDFVRARLFTVSNKSISPVPVAQ